MNWKNFAKKFTMSRYMLKSALALFVALGHCVYAQNLTVSTSGQTGTSGTNWSINGNTLSVTGTASIKSSVIQDHLSNIGPLEIIGNTGNFSVTVNEVITVSSSGNELVIGSNGNSGFIAINQNINTHGNLTVHAGNIYMYSDLSVTSTSASILLKTHENIVGPNATDGFVYLGPNADLTTNGGNIILWTNTTNRTAAYGQANNEIVLEGNNVLNSNGGKIILAGGLDDGSNGGIAADGIPDGFAYRGSYGEEAVDIRSTVTLNSGGGEIIIRGEQNGSDVAVGADATFTISNGGAVTIEGKNTTATSVALGTANITSTATNSPVTISGTTHITNSGLTTITTQGGDVLLASNVDDATDGESVTNGYIRMGSGLSVTTIGGDITIGGGDATGSGYALGSTALTAEGIRIDGTVNLDSGNGNIALRGKSYAVAVANQVGGGAIMFYNVINGSINSGTGTLLLDGYSQTTGGNAIAGLLWWNDPTASTFTIESANTTTSAITLNGYSTSSTGQSYGIEVEATNTLNVYATGTGGGISINGGRSQSNADPNENRDIVFRGPVNILANSGPISIKGGQLGGVSNGYWFTTLQTQIGSKASTAVTSSASDITIAFDRFWFDATYFPKLATSGTVSIAPLSVGFGMGVSSAWFQYNQNGQTMTGLTLGKAGNTADINHEITAITVAGPISVYGGTISVNADLTTTSGSGGDVSLYTDNNLGGLSSACTITADGAFKLIPNGTSFSNNISYPITNLNLSSKGLTIGKSGNTADINIMQAQTIAGPISVYGGNIGINENLNTSAGAADGDVLLKASGNNNLANGKSITTSGGDVTFWSDSDGNGTGYAQVGSATAITTAGGNITLGGGSDIATGYARGAVERDAETDNVNILHISGVHLKNGASLSSGGGNITLRGQNYLSSALTIDFGVMGHNATLDAGSGKVAIIGKATGLGTSNTQAISVYGNGWTIRSSNSDADAIVLNGDGSGYNGNTTTLGINFAGIIESTGGGGIQLTGKSGTAAGYDHPLDIYGSILANSGTITITAENNDATQTGLFLSGATLGFKSATNVQASTSNIILKSDNTVFNSATNLNTTGAVSLLPLDASSSFGVAQTIGSNMVLSSGVSGLTIGKAGNTANVTISNAIDIAGPISVYGGDIAVNENLSSSTGSTISLYGNTLNFASGKTVTSNNGQLIVAPQNPALTIGMAGASGNLSLPASYFSDNFTDGFSNVQIGSANQTGGISTNAFNLQDNMTLLTSGTLTLGGKPVLGANNMTLGEDITTIDVGVAQNYFKSESTGRLKRQISDGNSRLLPIGRAHYNPVTITNNSGSTDVFSAGVLDAVFLNGFVGPLIETPHVKVTWDLDKENANGGNGIQAEFGWFASQEEGTMSSYRLNHHNGTNWEFASGTSNAVSGSSFKTMEHINYIGSFSPFAISEDGSVLPVEFLGMQYDCLGQQGVSLTWQTASELNAQHFEVMCSENGFTWEQIGTVAATGTSNQLTEYQFLDESPVRAALRYYQLKQEDFDGQFEWLPIISVNCEASGGIRLYPNPAQSKVVLEFTHDAEEMMDLRIYDALGHEVKVEQIAAMIGFNRIEFNVSELPSGAYQLRIGLTKNLKLLNLLINR